MPSTIGRGRGRFAGRGRVVAVVGVAILVLIVLSLRGIASFYTDYLWFDALDQSNVFSTILGAKVALVAIFSGAFFVLLLVNLIIADRLAPPFRPPGPEEELLERYYATVGHRSRAVRVGVSLLFAAIAGAGVSEQWNEWLLYRNGRDVGVNDPQFGRDIGYYLFKLPFESYVVSWLFAAFVIIFIVTAVAHYLNGGIRMQTPGERVTPQVKAHLSVLLAALALFKAADYWHQRFELTLSTRGTVDGATFTDVNAQLPAIQLLMMISLFAVVLLLVNIRFRGWTLPVLAVGLWAFINVIAGTIYPSFVQRFQVEPAESSKEEPFIDRNIAFTRAAYGLDEIEVRPFELGDEISRSTDLSDAELTIANARLLDPVVLTDTYDNRQGEREFYRFNNVLDVDRYMIDGKLTPVVLGARELDPVSGSWENAHVTFTHGYGLALAPANAVQREGEPDFAVGDLPVSIDPRLDIVLDRPQIYYGEKLGGYAIVGATKDETDFASSKGTTENRYDGEGGVAIGGFTRRAAFALRFGEVDPLISDLTTSESRIIFQRDVRERVQELAPFLQLDDDIYPVVVDGGIKYIIEGYTTSNRYPYSQRADVRDLPSGSGLRRNINYVRNSVKAVVDAYDGTVNLYVVPGDDPIIDAYRLAFPELFSDFADMPESVQEHLRYPQDLFRIQTNMWARYHIDDAATFYGESRWWSVAQDPGRSPSERVATDQLTDAQGNVTSSRERRVDPYYQLIQLPGEDEVSFVTTRTFVPQSGDDSRKELEAFMVGEGDRAQYGRLVVYEMPTGEVNGPSIVASNINSEQSISESLTLLDNNGSKVNFGDLILLPINNSIVYVRALYVEAQGTKVPRVQQVIAIEGDNIAVSNTLQGALERLFRQPLGEVLPQRTGPQDNNDAFDPEPPPPPASSGEPSEPNGDPETLEEVLEELARLLRERGAEDERIAELLEQAIELNGGEIPDIPDDAGGADGTDETDEGEASPTTTEPG